MLRKSSILVTNKTSHFINILEEGYCYIPLAHLLIGSSISRLSRGTAVLTCLRHSEHEGDYVEARQLS